MADTHVETSSELNQDSLDGAQATVSEVGSAEEFEKETTEDTPSGSHGEAEDENTGDVPDAANGEESREVEDSVAVVTENGSTEEAEHHVNGNGTAKNGEAEADSTEVDASAGEKRKSIVDADVPLSISPKKARVEGEEAVVEDLVVPTNGTHETVA